MATPVCAESLYATPSIRRTFRPRPVGSNHSARLDVYRTVRPAAVSRTGPADDDSSPSTRVPVRISMSRSLARPSNAVIEHRPRHHVSPCGGAYCWQVPHDFGRPTAQRSSVARPAADPGTMSPASRFRQPRHHARAQTVPAGLVRGKLWRSSTSVSSSGRCPPCGDRRGRPGVPPTTSRSHARTMT